MLHYALSALAAMATSVMILVNGELTAAYDLYLGTVIIHVVGLALISAACAAKRERMLAVKGIPPVVFLGGAIGVLTTMFNNLAYGQIDVSVIVALNLVGQAVSALIVDQFGLFGMPTSKLNSGKLLGVCFMVIGIAFMMSGAAFKPVPVILSLLTGVTLTLARYLNAQLAARTSTLVSTWYNYVVGLTVAAIVWAGACMTGTSFVPGALVPPAWIYLGGAIGVMIVLQANISTRHLSAFAMTLVLFIGQIFMGVVLDAALTHTFPMVNMVGGIFVLVGLAANMFVDARMKKRPGA